ncbi:hypothetical protein EJ08DRAFT_321267 [Tothia fuscella]|uniref:KANL3/Tex30 alpha/beta hydrolase-like domain-containing protein n=1 Tax=Tothia fuscella TaxID=1048955 RepID=A0A9P4NNG8_9PEZI|nr:hypothetical protein EJ08DRAFT_321267 [Tothia fuscella]
MVARSRRGDDKANTEMGESVQPEIEKQSFEVPFTKNSISCVRHHSSAASPGLIFTHGAGGTLNALAMVNFAAGFAPLTPLTFFQGSMNLKSRTKMFHAVIEHEKSGKVLGGRSMGARAAVLAAHEDPSVKALVMVSYPLKNEKGDIRDQILLDLREDIDVLFISGDGDSMCDLADLARVRWKMTARSWLCCVRDADHGMNIKPKKATDLVGALTGEIAAKWLEYHDAELTEANAGWDLESEIATVSAWSQDQTQAPSTKSDKNPPKDDTANNGKSTKDSQKSSNGKRKRIAELPKKNDTKNAPKPQSESTVPDKTATQRETRSMRRKLQDTS